MTEARQSDTPTQVGLSGGGLGPLLEAAWAIFVDSGNARMWSTLQPHLQKLAESEGLELTPLYVLTADDVAAVDAARKDRAFKALRRLDLCKCDHNEYCGHCLPLEFRPGGMWGERGSHGL